jgi:sulfatase maturation enzyme AslB (radical SAM superfamily)
MDNKTYLKNKMFCPIPWTGFQYNSNGDVLNCIRSQRPIGNLKDNSIHEILADNIVTKQNMLNNKPGQGCSVCYDLEKDKNSFDIISDRIFYLKELRDVPMDTYDDVNNFDLHKIDIRWSNSCNFGCVYCGPDYSSKWAKELEIKVLDTPKERVEELKQYVFDNAHKLKHVYLAGGEPLLMKENIELLTILQEKNPNVNVRVNTNLSKTGTPVFDKICEFRNVHWTVSVETLNEEFEYIRHGGKWIDFLENLDRITNLDHKITFNMLWFVLNYRSIFDCVDYLKDQGYHNNSFVIGPILGPDWLDVRNLPNTVTDDIQIALQSRINQRPGYLLEESYKNMLQHVRTPFNKDLNNTFKRLKVIDQRRGLNSKTIFTEVYECLQD